MDNQKVIEYKWLHHLSLNQTAAKFSIPNTGTISTWEKLYHSYGFSGLLAKKRGRPSMKKSKLNLNTKLTNLKKNFLMLKNWNKKFIN
ncbi:helix-turn-helix domain-containing protein [Megamonas funiformis]|uniref:helix-turn-helix domain-containing protein n=1 Tax=Megamonas funiformis TaxID=437897 RepID=UPI0022DF6286|nr:helix-turn-helix domain-containing protein [Megamonas funiformis]